MENSPLDPSPKWRPKFLNKSKLKIYTSTKKNTFTLVTLQSFSSSGVLSAEKMKLKIGKFTVCMTGGIMDTLSHTNVCKFFNFQLTFSRPILHLKC